MISNKLAKHYTNVFADGEDEPIYDTWNFACAILLMPLEAFTFPYPPIGKKLS